MTTCACSGMRSCALCADSARVRQLRDGAVALRSAGEVLAHQHDAARTSSCAFACVAPCVHTLCIACGRVYAHGATRSDDAFARCDEHADAVCDEALTASLRGLHVCVDAITPACEAAVVRGLDGGDDAASFAPWSPSQSGRRKQEYGPRINFKRRKVRLGDFAHVPRELGDVLCVMERVVDATTAAAKSFVAAEVSVLEYDTTRASSIDPHVDDTWLWGERIAGANLLADCVMTFVNGDGVAVRALLPRRCVFVLSGASRYAWMHGIRAEDVVVTRQRERGGDSGDVAVAATTRRISLTAREVSDEVRLQQPDLAAALQRVAHTYA